jgi:hypothetical protein
MNGTSIFGGGENMAEEVKVTSLSAGDVVQIESGVETVRALIETGYPSRMLVLFETGGTLSLTKPEFVTRLRTGQSSTPFRSPNWICGMPNKTKVRDLRPGDVLLELDWRTVRAVLRTSTDERVLVTEGEMGTQVSVTVAPELFEYRVVARGNSFGSWSGTIPSNVRPELVSPSQLVVGDELVVSDQVARVATVGAISRGEVTVQFLGVETVTWNVSDFVVRLIAIEPEPVIEPEIVVKAEFASAATAASEVATEAGGKLDVSGPARFCGQCGRERRPSNTFCTGCGNRFSTISTIGFQQ